MPLLTLHDPVVAKRYHDQGLWRDEGLYDHAARQARMIPDDNALRDSRRRLTWRQLERWARAIANVLAESGLKLGDRVAMALSNRAESVAVMLACSRNGYICSPSLHRNYTSLEMLSLVNELDAAAVIAEEEWSADGSDLIKLLQETGPNVACFSISKERKISKDFPSWEEQDIDNSEYQSLGADKICYVAFTSGTTGRPKGVMHSDNTILSNARDLVADWCHGRDTVLLSLSPLSHHIAWVGFAQALIAGAEFVVNDPLEGMDSFDWMEEVRANYVMGVPTHAIDLLAQQREKCLDSFGSVKVFYMAGAPISRSTAEEFVLQGVTPQNVYGMTENSSHQYTHPEDDTDIIVGTCGRGGPSYQVKIFDSEDNATSMAVGQVGEIGGRGAALMLGYFGDQKSTENSFNRDGWFMSGDLGRLDAAGNLEIVGRVKDIIIRGGRNIHPRKIEDLAVRHPLIEKAAVIPVEDSRLGEKVCLIIVPSGDEIPGPDMILRHLHSSGLSVYDMPEYYAVLAEFPLTASGKILKRALLQKMNHGDFAPISVRFNASFNTTTVSREGGDC